MGVSKWILQVVSLLVLVIQPSTCSGDWHDTVCVMLYCPFQLAACEFDTECRGLLDCMNDCENQDAECAFTCGMTSDAGKNKHFLDFLYCVIENHCTQGYEESGVCLATDEETLQTQDYAMVEGGWWTVYGQSCGQDGWEGAYDWYPCSHAEFRRLETGDWINNTTYCSGTDSNCDEIIVTVPKVYWSSPGVLRHDYPQEEAPIIPQIEDWKWLWVNGDWALVIWCGENPMLKYNGGFILSRNRSDGIIPDYIMEMLEPEMAKYGLKLEEMCLTDSTQCTQVP
jgi:hypothetical protein